MLSLERSGSELRSRAALTHCLTAASAVHPRASSRWQNQFAVGRGERVLSHWDLLLAIGRPREYSPVSGDRRRLPVLKPGGLFAPISRQGTLVLNNLFLTAGSVFVGTLYPLALDAVTAVGGTARCPFEFHNG